MNSETSIINKSYREKQQYYKSLVNRENGPKFVEGKKLTLKEPVITERLIKHMDLLPVIQSPRDVKSDLLRQLFELTEAKNKAEKEAKRFFPRSLIMLILVLKN